MSTSSLIHPTALISPGAQLGVGVRVGARAIIEDQARLGAGCVVEANAIITSRVTMGERNIIGSGAVIGGPPQDFGHTEATQSEVHIGSGNVIGPYVTIHRGTKEGTVTVVGDDNSLRAGSHLAHNVQIANRVLISDHCLLAGYVIVDDDATLGSGAVFHQFIRIGQMAMVPARSSWSKDVPPYCAGHVVNSLTGLNGSGMRRKGVPIETRAEIERAYELIFHSGMNVSQALDHAQAKTWGPEANAFFAFIRSAKRGICRLEDGAENPEA